MPTTQTLPQLYVTKRNGQPQPIQFDKILTRIRKLCNDPQLPPLSIDVTLPAQKVIQQLYAGVTTAELDELAAHQCTSMCTQDPAYGILAKRIVVSNHHKNTRTADGREPTFGGVMESLYACTDSSGISAPLVSDELIGIVREHGDRIQAEIDDMRDYTLDYFGFKTLEKSYLLQLPTTVPSTTTPFTMPSTTSSPSSSTSPSPSTHTVTTKIIAERPQHMWMRVAIGLYGHDLERAFRCYHELSTKCYTHATPTLFNSGTPNPQLASCFLLQMQDDSIRGIFDTLGQCAMISKHAGGIGLNIHNVRAKNAMIRGTNGTSNGIVPMLRVFNDTARYVDQGGGKRNGSFAIYMEPWHADIEEFLHLKRNHGDELSRARDLFYALWVPDLFMERVLEDGEWTLFDPNSAPGLDECHGAAFRALYQKYVTEGRGRKTIRARKLWTTALESMVETGTPYILFKDACNRKSNQQNLGTIKSSNLCTEIIEYSSADETAVCNLASLCLPACVAPLASWQGKHVEVHTKKGCPFCGLAVARLKLLQCDQVKMVVYDATTDTTAFRTRFAAFARTTPHTASETGASETRSASNTGVVTFPQLVVDGTPIGGFDALVDLTRQPYDFEKLGRLTRSLVRNLNQTIDRTYYPIPETCRSNARHRPIGIGVQGLADVFYQLRYAFDSNDAKNLHEAIFATIYYHAMAESATMAQEREDVVGQIRERIRIGGWEELLQVDEWWTVPEAYAERLAAATATAATTTATATADDHAQLLTLFHQLGANWNQDLLRQGRHPFRYGPAATTTATTESTRPPPPYSGAYATFEGSPLSQGKFQFDLWDDHGGHQMYDWDALRTRVQRYGTWNSLLVAPMPTASTAQIMGNTECFEVATSNIYNRRTLAGEFIVVNRFLLQDLMDAGIWSADVKDEMIYHGGSVQEMTRIPGPLRSLYKTVWDTSQKVVIDLAADRGRYICQSQSMNLFLATPSMDQISSMLMYGWKKGLKTGMYYLRTQPASKAQQFTLDPTKFKGSATNSSKTSRATGSTTDNGLPTVGGGAECLACSA